jgi:hypothetical protein
MGEQDGEATGGFTVRDKRRFDSSGVERSETEERKGRAEVVGAGVQAGPSAAPQKESFGAKVEQPHRSVEEKATEKGASALRREEETAPGLDFASFIISLATQAFWQLGLEMPPAGISVQKDIAAAKQTIDIISVLKAKTKGNLSTDEERLMEEVLHSLRMAFVRAMPS